MTPTTDTKEAVARLEAKLRGWKLGKYETSYGGFYLEEPAESTGDGFTEWHDLLNHTSAEGERWFAEQLRLMVAPNRKGWTVAGSVYRVQVSHESRSEAICLAIESAALQEPADA